MCFFKMPKFQDPTQKSSLLTPSPLSHLLLQLIHENMNIKLSEKMKILLVGSWPPISTYFKDTDSGLIEKSAVDPIKHVYFTFLIPILLLSRYFYDFLENPKKSKRKLFGRKEFELGPETLVS